MLKETKSIFFMTISILILVSGCGEVADKEFSGLAREKSAEDLSYSDTEGIPLRAKGASQSQYASTQESDPVNRKIIRTGEISIKVTDLKKSEKEIVQMVEAVGGYIATSSYTTTYLNLVVKVPAEYFVEFIEKIETVGEITRKQTQIQDVTDQYFDLELRLKNKRILLQKLESYVKQAKNIEEIMKIQNEITNLISEIERLEGQLKNLDRQLIYSTLTIALHLPTAQTITAQYPSFRTGLKRLWLNIISFFHGLLFVVLYIVVFGIPIILIVGLLYYICFGKLGLLKKFFIALSSRERQKSK